MRPQQTQDKTRSLHDSVHGGPAAGRTVGGPGKRSPVARDYNGVAPRNPQRGANDFYRNYVVPRVTATLAPDNVPLDGDEGTAGALLRVLFGVPSVRALPEINPLWRKYGSPDVPAPSRAQIDVAATVARGLVQSPANDEYARLAASWRHHRATIVAGLRLKDGSVVEVYLAHMFLRLRPQLSPASHTAVPKHAPAATSAPSAHQQPAARRAPRTGLTFILGTGTETNPELWWRGRGRGTWERLKDKKQLADASEAGGDHRTARRYRDQQLGIAISLGRLHPYQVDEIETTALGFEQHLRQTLAVGHRELHVRIATATPRDIDAIKRACQSFPGAIKDVELEGVKMTAQELCLVAEMFAWGNTPAVARARNGQVYDTASPRGRRQRQREATTYGGMKQANKPAGKGGLSQLGAVSAEQIRSVLQVIRIHPKHQRALFDTYIKTTRSAAGRTIRSSRKELNGKSLEQVARWLFGRVRRLTSYLDDYMDKSGRAFDRGWRKTQLKMLTPLFDVEITLANVEQIAATVDRVDAEVTRVAKPLLGGEKVDVAKVTKRSIALHNQMQAYSADARKVSDAFFGLNRREIMRLEAMYNHDYTDDLRTTVRIKLGRGHCDEALAYLDLDLATATAHRLRNSVSEVWALGNDEEERVYDTLEKVPASVRKQLHDSKDPEQKHLLEQVREHLDGPRDIEKRRFDALLAGDEAQADALAIVQALGTRGHSYDPRTWTEDEDKALSVLRGKSAKHNETVAKWYFVLTGAELTEHLDAYLDQDQADEGYFSRYGDKYDAAAARLQHAAAGPGTDEAVIKAVYGVADATYRSKVTWAFERLYKDEWSGNEGFAVVNMFASEKDSDLEFEVWQHYRLYGKLDPGLSLYAAMKGAGTDVASIKKVLGEMKPGNKRSVCRRFRHWCYKFGDVTTNHDAEALLREWLASDLSGADEKEAELLLFGAPQTPGEMRADIERRYRYERKEARGASLTKKFHGGIVADVERFKRQLETMVDDSGKPRIDKATGKPYTAAQIRHVYQVARGSLDAHAAAKMAIADAIKSGAEISLSAILTLASSGTMSPFLVAALSGATGVALKAAAIGPGQYGGEAIARDVVLAALAATLTRFTGDSSKFAERVEELAATFGDGAAKEIVKSALIEASKGAATGAVEELLKEANWRKDIGGLLRAVGHGATTKALTEALKGGTGAAGKEFAKSRMGEPLAIADALNHAFTEELTGVMFAKVAEAAVDADAWLGKPQKLLAAILRAALEARVEATKTAHKAITAHQDRLKALAADHGQLMDEAHRLYLRLHQGEAARTLVPLQRICDPRLLSLVDQVCGPNH